MAGTHADSVAALDHVLRRLELILGRRLDGILHGRHEGLLPGLGWEPGESRVYQPGDDVRLLDWAVTARTDVPHVRQPVIEHDVDHWVVANLSPSLRFGTAAHTKLELALVGAAAAALLAVRAGNRVGAVLQGPTGLTVMPLRRGTPAALAILSGLLDIPAPDGSGRPPLSTALDHVHGIARQRGVVAVVDDFLVRDGWHQSIRRLASRHHVLAIELVDPREMELPDVGLVVLRDPVTGRALEVQTASARLRRAFAQQAADHREAIRRELVEARIGHLRLATNRDWLSDIAAFLSHGRRLGPRRTIS